MDDSEQQDNTLRVKPAGKRVSPHNHNTTEPRPSTRKRRIRVLRVRGGGSGRFSNLPAASNSPTPQERAIEIFSICEPGRYELSAGDRCAGTTRFAPLDDAHVELPRATAARSTLRPATERTSRATRGL
jgi:hypothetical protein